MLQKGKKNLLLIEDNPVDVRLIEHFLKEASSGYELLTANSLGQGFQTIKEQEIHLVLLDLSLPDSNGFRTLTRYLESAAHIPVIVLTATQNEIIGNQAIRAGAQDYLVKGQFDSTLLGRSIRYAQQRRKVQDKLEEALHQLAQTQALAAELEALTHLGAWQMDILSNRMTWSEELLRILDITQSAAEPTLSIFRNYIHPDDRPLCDELLGQALQTGKSVSATLRVQTHRGIKSVLFSAKPFTAGSGQELSLIGSLLDLSQLPAHGPPGDLVSEPTPTLLPAQVLLIDNHDLNALALRRHLSQWAPHVIPHTAKSLEEGLVKLADNQFLLIIADLKAPGLEEPAQAIKYIRRISNAPLIVLSPQPSATEKNNWLRLGAAGYFGRALSTPELEKMIREILLHP